MVGDELLLIPALGTLTPSRTAPALCRVRGVFPIAQPVGRAVGQDLTASAGGASGFVSSLTPLTGRFCFLPYKEKCLGELSRDGAQRSTLGCRCVVHSRFPSTGGEGKCHQQVEYRSAPINPPVSERDPKTSEAFRGEGGVGC